MWILACAIFLVLLAVVLADRREQRAASRAAQQTIASLQAQVRAHDAALVHVGRAVAAYDPQGTKPTAVAVPRPTDEQLAAAREARDAAAGRATVLPPSGPAAPPAEEPGREASPTVGVARLIAAAADDDEERTCVVDADPASRIGRAAYVDDPTLVSAGADVDGGASDRGGLRAGAPTIIDGPSFQSGSMAANDRGTPSVPPATQSVSGPVARRWSTLVAKAQADGKAASHCFGPRCLRPGQGTGPCSCGCDGCEQLDALLRKARREVSSG